MDTILVVNAGSSSVKFQVFGINEEGDLSRLIKGQMDGIGSRPRLKAEDNNKMPLVDREYEGERVSSVPDAIQEAGKWLRELQKFDLVAVGHRVVHGGPEYSQPIRVDREVLDAARAIHVAGAVAPAEQSRADPNAAGKPSGAAAGGLL